MSDFPTLSDKLRIRIYTRNSHRADWVLEEKNSDPRSMYHGQWERVWTGQSITMEAAKREGIQAMKDYAHYLEQPIDLDSSFTISNVHTFTNGMVGVYVP